MRLGALLLLLGACAREPPQAEPAPAEPVDEPVPEKSVRVWAMEEPGGWGAAWLESEGWGFFGFRIEAGSAGEVGLRWEDMRSGAEIATLSCKVKARMPLRALYGLRTKPPMRAQTIVECAGCGAKRSLRGTFMPDEIVCKRCKTRVPVNLDWRTRPARELRILLRGEYTQLRPGEGLVLSGQAYYSGTGTSSWLFGKAGTRHVPDNVSAAFDFQRQTGARRLFEAGTHTVSEQLHLPSEGSRSSSSVNRANGKFTFTRQAGPVAISGTREGYSIRVDGKQTPIAEYPYPAWRFQLTYKPD